MKVHQREKKKAKFRLSFVFLFIIASFAACFTFYMKEDFDVSQAFAEGEVKQQEIVSEMIEEADSVKTVINPVQKSEAAADTYLSEIFIIGTNQMKGLADYKVLPAENGYFDDNISISSIESAAAPYIRRTSYKAVYIMVGNKDLNSVTEMSDFESLGDFVESVRAENEAIDVYFVSLLPLSDVAETDSVTNQKIDSYNSLFLQYANSLNVYYLDLNTMFVGNDGKMLEAKTENDGIRLTRDAYIEIGEYILTHIGK